MKKLTILRSTAFSLVPFACLLSLACTPSQAQNSSQAAAMGAHLQDVVYDGSHQGGWYSFPGQSPKLHFKGDEVHIQSRDQSTVFLSRDGNTTGTSAEVSLARAPISTSSISGLAVMSDTQHALVIGLEGGRVVLWQLDPGVARVVASHQVNSSAPLEFRVAGGNGSDVRFYWRHTGDGSWHALGNEETDRVLASWQEPLRFGLLLDGPQGSQVTFSKYRSAADAVASLTMPSMQMGQ